MARGTAGASRDSLQGQPGDGLGEQRRRRAWAVAGAVVTALLFLGYLRVSWTVAATSDGAAQALQARDMLAGNWLLHGWTVSDVSFYTTELPEYMLVELVRPFGTGVIHVAAAVTYTLLVLGAFALARGRAHGLEGLVRGLLAAGIMLAPQLGYGAFVLLLAPDHVGTQVPLLFGWLLLDLAGFSSWGATPPSPRCLAGAGPMAKTAIALNPPQQDERPPVIQRWRATRRTPRCVRPPVIQRWRATRRTPRCVRPPVIQRWRVPFVVCLLLAWVQFADRVALLTAVLPLVLVCAVTMMRTVLSGRAAPMPAGVSNSAQARTDVDFFPRDGSAGLNRVGQPRALGQTVPLRVSRTLWPTCGHELALGLAALASVAVAWAGARVLVAAGGFAAHPLPLTLAPLRLLWTHAWLTGWGILELYGANFLGVTGWAGRAFAAAHLVGLALAGTAVAVALGRFLRPGARPVPNARLGTLLPAQKCIPLAGDAGGAGAELVDSVLAVGIVANLASYALSIEPGTVLGTGYNAREIAAVLPLGAVLAGRVLGPKLAMSMRLTQGRFHEMSGMSWRASARHSRHSSHSSRPSGNTRVQETGGLVGPLDANGTRAGLEASRTARREAPRGMGRGKAETRIRSVAPALTVFSFLTFVAAGYGVAFAYSAAQPGIAAQDEVLADWLVGHGLRYGLGGAMANVVTADSGERTVVAAVTAGQGRVRPLLYQSSAEAYDPQLHDATFLVAGTPAAGGGDSAPTIPAAAVRATFGPPDSMYRFDGYIVDIWNVNLLTRMR